MTDMQLRYPSITGKSTQERQKQMENYLRYLVETLNILLRNGT